MIARWYLSIALAWALCILQLPLATAGESKLTGLAADVNVDVDNYGVPHIYADSWTDAARVLGYLHASERLWQMDMLRRRAAGTTSEILGEQGLASDVLVRQLGTRRTCEAMWKSGELPDEFRAELVAYAAGVNSRIAELGEKGLPPMFAAMKYKPAAWSPVDSLVFSKYMAWDQAGTTDDLWFGMLVEKLGSSVANELWPLERPYAVPHGWTTSAAAARGWDSAAKGGDSQSSL